MKRVYFIKSVQGFSYLAEIKKIGDEDIEAEIYIDLGEKTYSKGDVKLMETSDLAIMRPVTLEERILFRKSKKANRYIE